MQAKQYEERILKLQDALELQKLKNTRAQRKCALRDRTLEDQLDKVQIALEQERDEKETILKNRRTNRLLMELQEERVQRLQDLQEIYSKDKQLELLANEMATVTSGARGVQDEITHKNAELTGLRASVRCSARLLQKAEKDFIETHRELEETQIKLMECKRTMAGKEKEVHVWIGRYEQVMMDLHAAQFRLMQVARGALCSVLSRELASGGDDSRCRWEPPDASAKDIALKRGYAVGIERDAERRNSEGELASIRPRPFSLQKNVGASDRAVRKYRQDMVLNRSQQSTASINNLHSVSESCHRKMQPSRSAGSLVNVPEDGCLPQQEPQRHACASRDCFQCSSLSNLQPTRRSKKPSELQPGSKYLGYGLGLLKKDHIVAPMIL
ncbi:hypothetical protein PybrP1_007434 [[Pythium] brassicae (nom. inval.)]|nr:hypothetical protein PybrP1_007434 [[Pythium] brassicae (nom. inval.)]